MIIVNKRKLFIGILILLFVVVSAVSFRLFFPLQFQKIFLVAKYAQSLVFPSGNTRRQPPQLMTQGNEKRTLGRKTGDAKFVRDGQWRNITPGPDGQAVFFKGDTNTLSVSGHISNVDTDRITVRFNQSEPCNQVVNIRSIDEGTGKLCGTKTYVVNSVKLRWAADDGTNSADHIPATTADLEKDDLVFVIGEKGGVISGGALVDVVGVQ